MQVADNWSGIFRSRVYPFTKLLFNLQNACLANTIRRNDHLIRAEKVFR